MRRTGQLLILLALLIIGCARGDWTTETLTLVDVTGTWEGVIRTPNVERTTRWVLQQKGGKVRGAVHGPDGTPVGSIEGLVNGEVFSWQMTGAVIRLSTGNAPSGAYRGEATVTLDEMRGRVDGPYCLPCGVRLRRAEPDARAKEPK